MVNSLAAWDKWPLGLIPEHFHTLAVFPFCPPVSFHNAAGLFSYPDNLRRDWQPVGPLHNRQAADEGRTVVHFLFLAVDLCFEFSRSPCGLTQGWWEFESSVSDGLRSVVSFSFSSATERGWREKEQKGQEKRRSKLDSVDVLKCDSCARNSWFLPPPKHPTVGSREARLDTFWHQN